MNAEVQRRLVVLRLRSYSDLQVLPEWSSEEVVVSNVASNVTTYREGDAAGPLKIIVQFSTKPERFLLFFKSRQVLAKGFRIEPQGAIHDLPEPELYDYM